MTANSWASGIFLIIVVSVWLKVNQWRFGDLLSPFNLLLFGWVGPLLLRAMNLSSLERSWSVGVYWSIAWTTVVLVAISFLNGKLPSFKRIRGLQIWENHVLPVLGNRKFARFVLLTFIISFAAYIYNEFVRNPIGVPLIGLYNNPKISREAFHRFGKDPNSGTLSPVGYLAVGIYLQSALLYMIAKVTSNGSRKWWIMLSALFPIMSVLKLSRIDLINTLSAFLIIEYYFGKFSGINGTEDKIRFRLIRQYPYAFATLVAIFAFVTLTPQFEELRGGDRSSIKFQEMVGTDIHVYNPIDNFLAEGYEYFALPFENFADTFDRYRVEFRPGIGFLRPLFALAGMGREEDKVLDDIGFGPKTGPANTFPFITLLYLESGIVGLAICPILYALLVNGIYARFRRKPNFLNFCLYLHMPYSWMWLFGGYSFIGLHFYLIMGYLWALGVYYRKYCVRHDGRRLSVAPPRRMFSAAPAGDL